MNSGKKQTLTNRLRHHSPTDKTIRIKCFAR